jgi:hypothetical protein
MQRWLRFLLKLPGLRWLYAVIFRPRLINFGLTYGYIRTQRMVAIAGRYGGYKTSLAVMIAYRLLADGVVSYYYSNIPCVWNDDIEALPDIDDPRQVSAVVVFDEAGQFFESRRDVKNVIAFLRKMNLILLMPSVEPPSARVTKFTIEPIAIFTSLGLPLVLYRAWLRGSRRSDDRFSYFLWWMPSAAFGVYDTEDAPVDAKGLDFALIALKDRLASTVAKESRFAKQQAHKDRVKAVRAGEALPELNFVPVAAEAGDLEETVDRLEQLGERGFEPNPPAKRGFGT